MFAANLVNFVAFGFAVSALLIILVNCGILNIFQFSGCPHLYGMQN